MLAMMSALTSCRASRGDLRGGFRGFAIDGRITRQNLELPRYADFPQFIPAVSPASSLP
jgi:hypothetical protein